MDEYRYQGFKKLYSGNKLKANTDYTVDKNGKFTLLSDKAKQQEMTINALSKQAVISTEQLTIKEINAYSELRLYSKALDED